MTNDKTDVVRFEREAHFPKVLCLLYGFATDNNKYILQFDTNTFCKCKIHLTNGRTDVVRLEREAQKKSVTSLIWICHGQQQINLTNGRTDVVRIEREAHITKVLRL